MPPEQDTQEQGAQVGPPLPDFSALEAQANALETQGQEDRQAQAAEEAAQAIGSATEELFSALEMLRMMAAPLMEWWPKFGETWNDRTLRGIAAGGAAVMQRHGWTMGEAWGQFGPYIALIGATLPPSLVTWAAIQERREQQRRQERQGQHKPQSSVTP